MQVLKGCLQVTIYASNVYSTGHHFCSLQSAVLEYPAGIYTGVLRDKQYLKVSESQKHFFLKLHCPKNELNILPYEARAEFCLIFRSRFGLWSFKKKCF